MTAKHILKQTTLCLLLKEDQILLAMKKRGFGMGKYNGCGGKLQDGETLEQCALREMREEIGVESELADLNKAGTLRFYFKNTPDWDCEVHMFTILRWQGEPKESDEMKPAWFAFDKIPYDKMWPDDKYWLPKILDGKKVDGDFYFNSDASEFEKFELKTPKNERGFIIRP